MHAPRLQSSSSTQNVWVDRDTVYQSPAVFGPLHRLLLPLQSLPSPEHVAPLHDVDALVAEAERHMAENEPKRAMALASLVLRRSPRHQPAVLLLCKCLVQLGEWQQAYAVCQYALSCFPQHFEVLYLSGKVLLEAGKASEAVTFFTWAIDAKADHLPSRLARGLTYHHHLKDPARAVSDFHASIVLNPTYYKAFFYIGMAMFDLDRHDLAVEAFSRSIQLNASYSESFFRRGIIHLQHHRLEQAIDDFNQVTSSVPGSAEAHYNCALAQHLLKRNGDAIASYKCCLQFQPTYFNALKNCAHAQSEIGLYAEAYDNYTTALTSCEVEDAAKLDILLSRGQLCERNQDWDQALSDYSEAIATMNPPCARAYTQRGLLYLQRQELDLALADFNIVVAFEPDNARAWNNRGTAFLQRNAFVEALADFDHAIALFPAFTKAIRNRGKALYLMGSLEPALTTLTAALQEPSGLTDPEAFLLRGSVHHSMGNNLMALKDLSRALEPARRRNLRQENAEMLSWLKPEQGAFTQ